jgi:hypothetical protein
MQRKLPGNISVDFDVTGHNPIFCICHILDKNWEYTEAVHTPFIVFKKAYNSVEREVLYYILTEFGKPIKLVRLIRICLNEIYSTVQVRKHLTDIFLIKNGLKQADALRSLLFKFALQ